MLRCRCPSLFVCSLCGVVRGELDGHADELDRVAPPGAARGLAGRPQRLRGVQGGVRQLTTASMVHVTT
jgi:hypothetical protein